MSIIATHSPLPTPPRNLPPSPATVGAQTSLIRTPRSPSAGVVTLDGRKTAEPLVSQADADMADKLATALMEEVNVHATSRYMPSSFGTVHDIPTHSTFGQLWSQLTHALKNEPFATFAKNNNINLSNLKLTPSGFLDGTINGKRSSFSKYDDGFEEAAVNVFKAVRKLSTNNVPIVYIGEHTATTHAVGAFYAMRVPTTKAEALEQIRVLQDIKTFPSLLAPEGNAARPHRQDVQHVRHMRDEAIQNLALQVMLEPGKFPQAQRPDVVQPTAPPGSAEPATTPIGTSSATTDPVADIARRQFAGEPNVYSVVARVLSDRLKEASPGLDFDINQIAIETPDPDNPSKPKRTQLMALAFDYLTGGDAPDFLDSARAFDTRPDRLARTGTAADTPLDLDFSALSGVMGALPDRLNQAYEANLREYWAKPAFNTGIDTGAVFSGSHRTLVSRILKSNLQLASLKQSGLDDEQRKTIDMVVRHPEGATRPAPLDPNSSGATVYSLADSAPNMVVHRYLAQANRDILLLVEPNGKITPFNSWDELESLGGSKEEMTGNLFDGQADVLINRHLGSSLISPASPRGPDSSVQEPPTLPDWMSNAGEAERFIMHELSLGLASFNQLNEGRSYNSDIKDIHTFAQQQFDFLPRSKKLTAHPAAKLEVVFKVAYGAQGTAGEIVRQTMSLTDMLLNNLSGLPSGQIEVFYNTGLKYKGSDFKVRVPELEKEGVLKQLVDDLDIGKTYPDLLRKKLLDDPTEKARRQALFAQQVPLELQFKALELSIKAESGFNTTGFRYVQELFKPGPGPRIVDGQEIVIRPLAFDNRANGKTDVVEGAYLIEPKDSTNGPHILYRPLMGDASLMQFPTRQALLEAIQNKGKLQNDILAWLPDEQTRNTYSGNGFKHPNLVIFGLNLGSIPMNKTIPLAMDTRLQQTLQAGTLMNHLYEANARSLITLAGQQSTSDAQSRWASLKEGGFLLLNSVLPVLRGPGAMLGLMMQSQGIINDLGVLLDDDAQNKEAALTDLLVNLTTLLAQFKERSLSEPSAVTSNRPATNTSVLIDGDARLTPPPQRFRMGGPLEKITPVDGEIQTNVDTYNRKGEEVKRLNIVGHAAKPEGEQGAMIVGEDEKLLTAEDVYNELVARGIDIRDYPEVRLLVCYSAKGGDNSLASQLHALTGVPVKGYEGSVVVGYKSNADIDPEDIYKTALAKYKAKYPRFSKADIIELAEMELNKQLKDVDMFTHVEKQSGKKVNVNWGTIKEPLWEEVEVDYRPKRFGSSKKRTSAPPAEIQTPSKELNTLGEYKDFKELPEPEKIKNSIAFTPSEDGQYEYFLDRPAGSNEIRLNIIGHGDKGGVTFKSNLKNAQSYSPEAFAGLIAPMLEKTSATQIRMISSKSGSTGFAEELSKRLNVPVKAPVGTVTQFEVMKDRYWILEKLPNPRRPHDHEWKIFTPPASASSRALRL